MTAITVGAGEQLVRATCDRTRAASTVRSSAWQSKRQRSITSNRTAAIASCSGTSRTGRACASRATTARRHSSSARVTFAAAAATEYLLTQRTHGRRNWTVTCDSCVTCGCSRSADCAPDHRRSARRSRRRASQHGDLAAPRDQVGQRAHRQSAQVGSSSASRCACRIARPAADRRSVRYRSNGSTSPRPGHRAAGYRARARGSTPGAIEISRARATDTACDQPLLDSATIFAPNANREKATVGCKPRLERTFRR